MQAATEPNPFLLDDPGVSAGIAEPRKAGPPGRPPPPNMASPAHGMQQQQQHQSKTAFDDLNDSIRMAMGNSPAKQALNTSGLPLGTPPPGTYATTFQPSPAKTQMGLIHSFFLPQTHTHASTLCY